MSLDRPRVAALDIGGTTLKAALFRDGALGAHAEAPAHAAEGAPALLDRAADLLASLGPFDTLGISTAGMVDPVRGVVDYANSNLPGYTGVCLTEVFSRRFSVPVAAANDANAAAVGEGRFGAAAGQPDFLCVVYGTGVGAGLVLDGVLRSGFSGAAGEMGAMVVHPEDRVPDDDPFSGCYERYASVSALVRAAARLDPALDSGRAVFAQLHRPDVAAVVDRWIDEIVWGLCSAVHLLQPRLIVLGGGVMERADLVSEVGRRLRRELIPVFRPVEVRGAALGNRAALYGAACLAERRLADAT